MKISIEEFKQLLASHQEELKEEGKRIEILRQTCADLDDAARAAERREERAKSELADAHQMESELRGRLYDLETKLFNTSRELQDRQRIPQEDRNVISVTNLIRATVAGEKIQSIKAVKELTNLNLFDAKKLVESFPTPINHKPMTEDHVRGLLSGAAANHKIQCIKLVRSALGLGLKEAKDLVEQETSPQPIGNLVQAPPVHIPGDI